MAGWLLLLSIATQTAGLRHHESARSNQSHLSTPPLVCTLGKAPFSNSALKSLLTEFVNVYDRRLHPGLAGGTLFFHQFYLYAVIKTLKPKHLIESGAFEGLGTWVLRQACPDCQITVISPQTPGKYVDRRQDSVYFTGTKFADFNQIDWSKQHLDMSKTLIFFDDHQSGLRRAVEAKARGFKYLVFDDNYVVGDNFSPKDACDPQGQLRSQMEWLDNFGKTSRHMSKSEAAEKFTQMKGTLKTYYEMPLLWSPATPPQRQLLISGVQSQGLHGAAAAEAYWARTKQPLLTEHESKKLIGLMRRPVDFTKEAIAYTYFLFTELQ